MSNAEGPIPEDGDTGLSQDEPSTVSTGDKEHGLDLDELYKLMEESSTLDDNEPEAIISTISETSSVEVVRDVSVLEELEALYGGSDESKTGEAGTSTENEGSVTESDSDGVDVLEELQALYGGSDESTTDETETFSTDEESTTESISDGVDVLAELETLYGGSDESITDEAETSSINEVSVTESISDGVDILAELETLYGGSNESNTDETEISSNNGESVIESVSDDVSVMKELEALYGDSYESQTELTETLSKNEESLTGSVFDGISGLEELETWLDHSVKSVTDEVELPSDTSEQFSSEENAGGMSALDELRVFLGEVVQPEAEAPDDLYTTSLQEHLFNSRRSVLDELQYLLQSSIDELKAAAEGNIGISPASTGIEYPSYDELKNLLETVIDQLMMISDSSTAADYKDSASALDELSAILAEASNSASMLDTSMSIADLDDLLEDDAVNVPAEMKAGEYESSAESGYGDSLNDEVAGADAYINELEALLGESGGTGIESSMSSSGSDDATTDISDESPRLNEIEESLSGSTGTAESETVQDYSTTSVPDTETADNPVLVELEAYTGDSSRHLDADTTTDVSDESQVLNEFEGLLSGSTGTAESEGVQDYSTASVPDAETADNPVLVDLEAYTGDSSRHLDADTTTDVSDESQVLNEFEGLLSGSTGTAESEGVQDYSTASVPDAETADNPVLVELEAYTGDLSRHLDADTTTDVSDESQVLNEFEGLLSGSTGTAESEGVQDYSTASVPDAETADNPVLVELEAYTGDSSRHLDADTTTDVSDESQVLNEFEGLLSGSTGTAESEGVQDYSTASVPDAETADNPVLVELEAYTGDLSRHLDADTTTDVSDESQVLNELEGLLSGSAGTIESEGVQDYLTASVPDAETADNPVLVELEAYTGDSSRHLDADTTTDVSDESQVLNEFEGLLSGSTGTAESEGVQDYSTASVPDAETADNPVLVELEAYTGDLSRHLDADTTTDVSDESQVLNELEGLLSGSAGTIESEGVQDYLTASVPDAETADNPVLVELEAYTGDSSRYLDADKATDVSDESQVLNEFEGLLSGSTGTAESEGVQDYSTTSVPDTGTADNPVLVELEPYLSDSSRHLDADTTTSTEEFDVDSGSDNMDSTAITLEQLEAMRDKPAGSGNNETSKKVKVIECDFIVEHEDEKVKDTRKSYDKIQHVETEEGGFIQDSSAENEYVSHETEGNKRISKTSILLVASVVVGAITFWLLLDTGDGTEDDFATTKTGSEHKSETVTKETASPVRAVDEPAETPFHAQISASIDRDVPSINEETYSGIKMDTYHVEQPEVADTLPDSRLIEPNNQTEMNHQEMNRGDSDLLNTRMAEAETSTVRLREEARSNHDEFAEPLLSDESGQYEQIETPVVEITSDLSPGGDNHMWSVHLSAYYNEPPPDIELEYLRDAGISYEIVKVKLDEKVWYRVLVDGFLQYRDAKEYAEMMESRFGIKKIWISNVQTTFD